jgi:Tfp pilus assembly PilM family ATPase/Tfp pilus assembly protein PilN
MILTTLNLSSNLIRYVAVGSNGALKYGSVAPEGLINNGLILQPDVIASQLKSLFAANSLPRERVICSINGLPFSYRLLTLPKMETEAFNEAVVRAIRKEIPISPEEMYLYWQAYPTEKNEWQVLVAGVTRQPVDSLIRTLREAGIPPYYLDLQPLSLARLTSEKDAIIVECEKDYSNIVLLVDGIPQALNIIPSLGAQAAQPEEVRQVTSKLIKMVDFYNGNHPKQPVKDSVKVLLTGELVNDAKVVDLVRQEVAYPIELLKPVNKAIAKLPLHDYVANAGSMFMDVTPKKETGKDVTPHRSINLVKIATELKGGGTGDKAIRKMLLWGTVAVGVIALVLAFVFQNQAQTDINQVQAELDQANEQYHQMQDTIKSTQSIQDDIDKIEAQIKSANDNYATVIDANDYVSDIGAITRSLPEDFFFTSFKIGRDGISVYGKTIKGSSVVQFARNLESIGGFSVAVINWIDYASSLDNFKISFLITITR